MKYELPKLPYPYEALEPYIDAKTMEIHHSKHHQAYVDKLNAVLEKYPKIASEKLESLLMKLPDISMDEKDKTALKNNGGGHFNHSFFWSILGPKKEIEQSLKEEIEKNYSSMDEFKKIFGQIALGHFGSGWAWLIRDENKKLQIYSLPNQDTPLEKNHTPLIALDVWEHAYYLKYQNRRAEYIDNWWNVLKLI